jgi:hypothetical protein
VELFLIHLKIQNLERTNELHQFPQFETASFPEFEPLISAIGIPDFAKFPVRVISRICAA